MEKYNRLIYESNLYPVAIINHFAATQTKWEIMSNRKRELMLMHINCCVIFCNMEMLQEKRSIDEVDEPLPGPSWKIMKRESRIEDSTQALKEMSVSGSEYTTSSSSTSTKSSTEKEIEMEMDHYTSDTHMYRFHMIRYTTKEKQILKKYCKEWKIEEGSEIPDIVDTKIRKFICIEITKDFNRTKKSFQVRRSLFGPSLTLLMINPSDLAHEWCYHPGGVDSVEKIKTFLLNRKEIIGSLKIIDSDIQLASSLVHEVMCCKRFNEAVSEWISDWNKEAFEKVDPRELYNFDDEKEVPKTVRAKDLLKFLDDLNGKERSEKISWKGRIMPEGWVHNIKGTWSKDNEMIGEVINLIKIEIDNCKPGEPKTNSLEDKKLPILNEIIDLWERSSRNIFMMYDTTKKNSYPTIDYMLGVGMKKRIYNPNASGLKQKENEILKKLKYDSWFDEVIRRLNWNSEMDDFVSYAYLLNKPPLDGHPIGDLSEESCTELLKYILKSNAALYSSKMTNLYSRVGGTYQGNNQEHSRMRRGVAMFPIYATKRNVKDHENKIRLISGIVLRGPNHTKSATDRIPIITLELMLNTEENRYLCSHNKSAVTVEMKNLLIIIRSNSIMKEDTAYCTFTANSLFNPINMLGVITLENPAMPQAINMKEILQNSIKEHHKWFTERFTEGILVAAIGNARDEGYFAHLRKLFLILFSWSEESIAACWNLESFCTKTNDCLVDNPISMYFHKELLQMIESYNTLRK